MATLTTIGIPQLDRRLEALGTREANRITRSALNQGLTVLAQAERQAIASDSELSPDVRRELKKLVGKRLVLQNARGLAIAAKAGLGVGQRPRGAKAKARAAAKSAASAAQRSGNSAKGVGISANNVHWFVLGTDDRTQPYKQARSQRPAVNKFVGRLQASRVIRKAASSLGRVYSTIEKVTRQKLDEAVNRLRGS
jgi:hypothetical protein